MKSVPLSKMFSLLKTLSLATGNGRLQTGNPCRSIPEVPAIFKKQFDFWPEPPKEKFLPAAVFQTGLKLHHLANTAYPIAHHQTIWQFRQPKEKQAQLLKASLAQSPEMCLYLHIPFCEKRCAFCEYTVLNCHSPEIERRYHQALLGEIALYRELLTPEIKQLNGLDIGGGTPAIIEPAKIAELIGAVCRNYRLSPKFGISIETTPKIAATDLDRLKFYRSSGIDRISMGLQMVNPHLLKAYGRDLHLVGYNARAAENIRQAGFTRFNIDVMYGFSRQSVADFLETLRSTIALSPDYITLYRMRYKGTKIADEATQIDLETISGMYEQGRALLQSERYLANPGKNVFSRIPGDCGTSAYLTDRVVNSVPYLGLGLGAQTFTNHLLAYNLGAASKKMEGYLKAIEKRELPIQDLYHLPLGDAIGKMISVAFYFGEISLPAFQRCFGQHLEELFPEEITFVLTQELMEYQETTIRLTAKGARFFNGVIALFYSDRVKAHLLDLMKQ